MNELMARKMKRAQFFWKKGCSIQQIFDIHVKSDPNDMFVIDNKDCLFINGIPTSYLPNFGIENVGKDNKEIQKLIEKQSKLVAKETNKKNSRVADEIRSVMEKINVIAKQTEYSEKVLHLLVIEAAKKKTKKNRGDLSAKDLQSIDLHSLKKKKKKQKKQKPTHSPCEKDNNPVHPFQKELLDLSSNKKNRKVNIHPRITVWNKYESSNRHKRLPPNSPYHQLDSEQYHQQRINH